MRRLSWFALCVALAACGPSDPPKKTEAPKKDATAPEVFNVSLDTSKGAVVIEVHKD